MGKIVCEVCGAAYPETSSRCPVCGSVRYSTPEPISDVVMSENSEREEKRPTSGRYTKANVKKRRKHGNKNAKLIQYIAVGSALILLFILLITLLLASCEKSPVVDPTDGTTEPSEETSSVPVDIPCVSIILDSPMVSFSELGQTFHLVVTCEPEDTTDQIIFESSDTTVVTVDEDGNLVAMAPGTAYITVFCGEVSAVCEVVCTIEEETEPPTLPPETLVLNRTDFTLSYKGATWQLYDGVIDVSLITFTSDNDAIATIVDGKVTAVGRGTTKVHAEFGDQKVSCIVRCSFKGNITTEGNGGVQEDNGTTVGNSFAIYSNWGKVLTDSNGVGDISMKVGSKVELFLRDENENAVKVDWSVNKEGYVSINGTEIIADAKGTIVLTATYKDVKYKCILRISE